MSWSMMKTASWGAATLMGAALLAGPALADGMPSRGKISHAPEGRTCSTTGNVGVTSDYVFRGISQSNEEAAIQGGVEFSCGRFYAGFWGSSVAGYVNPNGSEIDIYGGYKTTLGRFALDVGFIYYAYPGIGDDANYVEVKAAGSTEIWKGGTVSGTVFYSPQYLGDAFDLGAAATYEVGLSQALPKVGMFTPTFSAMYGYTDFLDTSDASYAYWNVGVSLGFLEKWSLDLRYHDTDGEGLAGAFNSFVGSVADERFVATLKYTF